VNEPIDTDTPVDDKARARAAHKAAIKQIPMLGEDIKLHIANLNIPFYRKSYFETCANALIEGVKGLL